MEQVLEGLWMALTWKALAASPRGSLPVVMISVFEEALHGSCRRE